MKVTVRYEALNARNESTSKTFDIDFGELALMIEIDRHEQAKQAQKPVEDINPRDPQRILDELWRAEEAVNHQFNRGDRGRGRKACTCGAGWGGGASRVPIAVDPPLVVGSDTRDRP